MINTPQNKPREFWLAQGFDGGTIFLDFTQGCDHVIEYQAYLAERTRAEKAIAALKIYKDQPMVRCSECGYSCNGVDDGETARKTLRELDELEDV